MKRLVLACAIGAILTVATHAAEITRRPDFAALAADRKAAAEGDIITVLVYENSSARNSAASGSSKETRLDGRVSASTTLDESAGLGLSGKQANSGSTARSGQMVAQISTIVEKVLPNGDLQVAGQQYLDIAGERSLIRVRGRVRAADITTANTVLSSRLADAEIEYNGKGFVSRGAKPGVVSRIFGFLGLM